MVMLSKRSRRVYETRVRIPARLIFENDGILVIRTGEKDDIFLEVPEN